MALPNHHHQRGFYDMADNDDATGGYVLVRCDDLADLRTVLDAGYHRCNALDNAARQLVDNAVDVAVGSAGDRMLGPDNPVRPMPATDNDGELWKLLAHLLKLDLPATRAVLRDAIAARYGH